MSKFGLLVDTINAKPHIKYINRSPFPGEKVSEHEVDHSTPTKPRLKICEATSPLPICLQDKHRNKSISIMKTVKYLFYTASNTKQCER